MTLREKLKRLLKPKRERTLKHLFHPSPGIIPPYLAGRKKEQAFFQKSVARLLNKTSPDRDMVVYGPRGNGKTAMLRYLQEETLKNVGNDLDILWVTPDEMGALEGLVDLIIGDDQGLLDKAKDILKNRIAISEMLTGIEDASAKTASGQPKATIPVEDMLHEKSKKKPFILIIDEAHTLTPEMGGTLLNASQDIRGEDWPFFMVLAGTPNLTETLRKTGAGFWERSRICRLGRLSMEEAHQALTIPLESCQVTFAQGAIEEVVSRAQCYPFFIQIWGDCIANNLHETGAREVTMDTVTAAQDEAIEQCAEVYSQRYNELDEMNLLPLATHISRAFTEMDREYIPGEEFKELIGEALQERGLSATHEAIFENIEKLAHIGYIWQINVPIDASTGGILHCYEPGIPDLMQYVRRQALSQTGQ